MEKVDVEIKAASGIHARPATAVVKKASAYKSNIKLIFGEKEADAKRLLAILSLGVKQNDVVTVTAEGEDEKEAIADIESTLLNEMH